MISVCIVSGRRPQQLGACLDSLRGQIGAPPFEVLVAADGDAAVADTVVTRFPEARVGLVRGTWLGASRNFLIARARGDLLLFLDDDVVLDPGFLQRLAATAAEHPGAGLFGGPNLTPPGSSRFEVLQGAVLGSRFGSGPVRRRYGRYPAGEADERWFTLCGMAIARDVVRPFPHDLTGGEENALMVELSRAGVVMHYSPDLFVYHDRRPTVRSFLDQMRKYGRGRGQLMRRNPGTVRPSYLLPLAVVGVLLATPLLAVQDVRGLGGVVLYSAVVALGGIRVGAGLGRLRRAPAASALIVGVHLAYGIGVAQGLLSRARPRDARASWVDILPSLPAEGNPSLPAPEGKHSQVGEVRP